MGGVVGQLLCQLPIQVFGGWEDSIDGILSELRMQDWWVPAQHSRRWIWCKFAAGTIWVMRTCRSMKVFIHGEHCYACADCVGQLRKMLLTNAASCTFAPRTGGPFIYCAS
jgi:hypothetical protein